MVRSTPGHIVAGVTNHQPQRMDFPTGAATAAERGARLPVRFRGLDVSLHYFGERRLVGYFCAESGLHDEPVLWSDGVAGAVVDERVGPSLVAALRVIRCGDERGCRPPPQPSPSLSSPAARAAGAPRPIPPELDYLRDLHVPPLPPLPRMLVYDRHTHTAYVVPFHDGAALATSQDATRLPDPAPPTA
jgi:hypothetical protein